MGEHSDNRDVDSKNTGSDPIPPCLHDVRPQEHCAGLCAALAAGNRRISGEPGRYKQNVLDSHGGLARLMSVWAGQLMQRRDWWSGLPGVGPRSTACEPERYT